jgi:hypothetical protein
MKTLQTFLICVALISLAQLPQASKLVEVKVADKDYLLVYLLDEIVVFTEDMTRADAYTNSTPGNVINKAVWYGTKLRTEI